MTHEWVMTDILPRSLCFSWQSKGNLPIFFSNKNSCKSICSPHQCSRNFRLSKTDVWPLCSANPCSSGNRWAVFIYWTTSELQALFWNWESQNDKEKNYCFFVAKSSLDSTGNTAKTGYSNTVCNSPIILNFSVLLILAKTSRVVLPQYFLGFWSSTLASLTKGSFSLMANGSKWMCNVWSQKKIRLRLKVWKSCLQHNMFHLSLSPTLG